MTIENTTGNATFGFEILSASGTARRGRLTTPHGVVETPALIATAPLGSVFAVSADELEAAGGSAVEIDFYHLGLRPGLPAIGELGGVHAFTGWSGPILGASGAAEIFAHARVERRDKNGLSLRNHLDGTLSRLEPSTAVRDQQRLGADVVFALDDAAPRPDPELTLAWARAARGAWTADGGGLFAAFPRGELAPPTLERAGALLTDLDFAGVAVDATASAADARRALAALPPAWPRYWRTVGGRRAILEAIGSGADLVAVGPFTNETAAKEGRILTPEGPLRITDERYRDDPRPLVDGCSCPFCRRHDRAYLHYLVGAGELTGAVYVALHNLRMRLDFMAELRERIASGTLASLESELAAPPNPSSSLDTKPDRR